MDLGEVARLCRVGEGRTSSGLNSGSSANRSSKYVPDKTLHTDTSSLVTLLNVATRLTPQGQVLPGLPLLGGFPATLLLSKYRLSSPPTHIE